MDANLFVKDLFKQEGEPWQKKALGIISRPDPVVRLALAASAGVGKSWVDSAVLWWMMMCQFRGQHPLGSALSMTKDNLEKGLWAESKRFYTSSSILTDLFEFTGTKIYHRDSPGTWECSARSFPKDSDEDSQGEVLSGLHCENIFYVIDESGGIKPGVVDRLEQGLSTTNIVCGRAITSGNTLRRHSMLYRCSKDPNWEIINITGDPDDPNRSIRVDINWAREKIEKKGRKDPWVMAYVLGQFPDKDLHSLLTEEDVTEAMSRATTGVGQVVLGCDFARFGGDGNAFIVRKGQEIKELSEMGMSRTEALVARAIRLIDRHNVDVIAIDSTGGYGIGVADALIELGYNVYEVASSEEAPDDRHFLNMRAWMWRRMANWVLRGGCLPDDPELKEELSSVLYLYSKKGDKFQIESKDDIRKRIDRSPDKADALALTFVPPPMAPGHEEKVENVQRKRAEYDPIKKEFGR